MEQTTVDEQIENAIFVAINSVDDVVKNGVVFGVSVNLGGGVTVAAFISETNVNLRAITAELISKIGIEKKEKSLLFFGVTIFTPVQNLTNLIRNQ